MASKKHQSKKRPTGHANWHVFFVILTCVIGAVVLFSPEHITPVKSDLEDIQKFIAERKKEQLRMELQATLAPGEVAIESYQEEPRYFQITDTCDWQYATGECVLARTGPGMLYEEAYLYYEVLGAHPMRIRLGQVFPMSGLIKATDGTLWYKVSINKKTTSFPARFKTDWYVPAEHFIPIDITPIHPEQDATKSIVIVLHSQELYAYENKELFMKAKISTGTSAINLGTDTGNFRVFKKTPMKIMEGPLPSMVDMVTPENIANFEYTLFVPYAMAFEASIAGISYIHEAYWHNAFGSQRSHGCVNLSYADAAKLYQWTPDPSVLKIPVTVLP